jgi:hypothetical protein
MIDVSGQRLSRVAFAGYARAACSSPLSIERPDLYFLTSYNKLGLKNWCMLLRRLPIPTVVDLYAKPPFLCANYASPSSCCVR